MRTSGGINRKLPIKSDEESILVAGVDEISNFNFMKDLADVIEYLKSLELYKL